MPIYGKKINSGKLKRLIQLHPLSLTAISKEIGITSSALSRITNGIAFPTVKTLDKICRYLQIDKNDLIVRAKEIIQIGNLKITIEEILEEG